jgi:fatty acid desaturase
VPNWSKLAISNIANLVVLFLFWIVFVGTFAIHELWIGVLATLLTVTGLLVVEMRIHHASHQSWAKS